MLAFAVTDGGKRRRRVRRSRPRAQTVRRITQQELRIGAAMYPVVDVERPRTRGDCAGDERPCPFVACRHHLYLDINPGTGSIKINFPDLEPWELKETCALDVADRGGATFEQVGEFMNITRERTRQIEAVGLQQLRSAAVDGVPHPIQKETTVDLDEYIKLASGGAPVIIITPAGGGPIVAHAWAASVAGRGGWEYVLADYHGKIIGQAWAAGTAVEERDREIAATIAKLAKRLASTPAVA